MENSKNFFKDPKILAIFGAVALVAIFIVWGAMSQTATAPTASSSPPDSSAIIYYYGEECPHCKDVAKFLEENNIAEKVSFEKKEVWHNEENNAEMQSAAKECGLPSDSIGVPFLWARGECIIGTPGVTGFFEKEAGVEK